MDKDKRTTLDMLCVFARVLPCRFWSAQVLSLPLSVVCKDASE